MSASTLAAALDALSIEDLSEWSSSDVYLFIRWADDYSFEREQGLSPTPRRVMQLYRHFIYGETEPMFLARRLSLSPEETKRRRRQWEDRKKRISSTVYERDGHACVMCGRTDDLTIDHITPISRGGSDDPDNLQTACLRCNTKKGVRL